MARLRGGSTVGGYKIWHDGNVGTDSGLNADLIDGLDSDQFLRSDIATTHTQGSLSLGEATGTAGSLFIYGYTAGTLAQIQCTNGNLHIDANIGNDLYLNFYRGSNVRFGNGASGTAATMTSNGDLSCATVSATTVADAWGLKTTTSGNPNDSGIWFTGNVAHLILRDSSGNVGTRLSATGTYAEINNRSIVLRDSNSTSDITQSSGSFVVDSGGTFSVKNPDNILATLDLSWITDAPRIRIGGSGAGAGGDFLIQGTGNFTRLTLTSAGDLTVPGVVTGNSFVSTVSSGTAPFTVSSTTKVTNLNTDLFDGLNSSDFLRSNLSTSNRTAALTITGNFTPLLTLERTTNANSAILFSNTNYSTYLGVGTSNGELMVSDTGDVTGTGSRILTTTDALTYLKSNENDEATGIITFKNSSNFQIVLDGNNSTYAGIQFIDSGDNDYIFYYGPSGTFSIGGGSSTVAGKKLHIDGGTSIGAGSDAISTPTNGLYVQGPITNAGNYMAMTNGVSRVKYCVWDVNSPSYGIGMDSSYSFGPFNNSFAMTFQMDNTAGRGFWWGDSSHSDSQGAMGLTTDGRLTIAHSLRIGYGEADTTIPGLTHTVDINGSLAATTKSFLIDHPIKEGMKLRYGSLEGPENGVYVRGKSDNKVIELPDYWVGLIDPDSITVQLTGIGRPQELFVDKIENNKIFVGGLINGSSCFYFVQAERVDVDKLIVEF